MKKILIAALIFVICSDQTSASSQSADVLVQEGQKLAEKSLHNEARDAFQNALTLNPEHMTATFHLGLTSLSLHDHETAINCFRKLHKKGVASASYNLAFILRRVGFYQEAIEIYEKLLEQDPNSENIPFGLANAYLTVGDFAKGLPTFERGRKSASQIPQKLEPDTQVQGKTILIIEEWGFGDTLHFIRYAKLLKERGARTIIVCARTAIHKLLSLCPYIDQVYPLENPVRALSFDYQVSMMSLMHTCKTTAETIPNQVPYLYADRKLIEIWHERLAHDTHFKIGVNWKGTLDKNMNPELLLPLTQIPGISLYSVQKSNHELSAELKKHIITFPDFDETHGSFMDTAALIRNLDLVITVDTSIAHLAGGLGVPTWILIPHWADWRWFTNKIDSPWYPTMKIFRQPKHQDWKSVIDEVCNSLREIVK
jgi:tetratricopeptide (TPR) repeat protein